MASDLHLLYEVTPTYVDLDPDWGVYYSRFMELSPVDQVCNTPTKSSCRLIVDSSLVDVHFQSFMIHLCLLYLIL